MKYLYIPKFQSQSIAKIKPHKLINVLIITGSIWDGTNATLVQKKKKTQVLKRINDSLILRPYME